MSQLQCLINTISQEFNSFAGTAMWSCLGWWRGTQLIKFPTKATPLPKVPCHVNDCTDLWNALGCSHFSNPVHHHHIRVQFWYYGEIIYFRETLLVPMEILSFQSEWTLLFMGWSGSLSCKAFLLLQYSHVHNLHFSTLIAIDRDVHTEYLPTHSALWFHIPTLPNTDY